MKRVIHVLWVLVFAGTLIAAPPLRVGGEVKAPVLIKRVQPSFAHLHGELVMGQVILECTITTDGRVREVRVMRGPRNEYEAAIVAAVRQWRFKPATLHGKPVEVLYPLVVTRSRPEPGQPSSGHNRPT